MVPAASRAHLDFGCYEGRFLDALSHKNIARLVGVDAAREPIERGRQNLPHLELHHLTRLPLPFAEGEFSSVSLMDVLEHVPDQRGLLAELHRVLESGGLLIVTVPGQHVFSLLDVGNLKFRFPRLHRWHYCRTHSPAEYEYRYQSNPDGLIGDVSADKQWHEHFSRTKLRRLLEGAGFRVECFDGTSLFVRPLRITNLILGKLRPLRSAIDRMIALDARWFQSANLFCQARKNTPPTGA